MQKRLLSFYIQVLCLLARKFPRYEKLWFQLHKKTFKARLKVIDKERLAKQIVAEKLRIQQEKESRISIDNQ
jgi:hypothetical protein